MDDSITTDGHLQPGLTEQDGPLRGYSAIAIGQLPSLTDYVHAWPSSERKALDGRRKRAVVLTCPRCKRGLCLDQFEFIHPPGQPIPLCADCLREGERVVLQERWYESGPVDLRL